MQQLSFGAWVLIYALSSLWWKWILSWGGAHFIEGVASWFTIGWFAPRWDAEQIRLYALCIWVIQTIWFVLGLFWPEARVSRY